MVARTSRTDAGDARSATGSSQGPQGRVPPHDLDAEKAVLSALLLDNRALHEVATEVRADDFYHPAHQTLFGAMIALQDEQKPCDLITLSEHLSNQGLLDAVGGAVALAEIADYEATAANVVHYAHIVRDKAVKRGLISVATEIVEEGFGEAGAADQLLDFAESRIFEISTKKSKNTFSTLNDEMIPTFDYIERIMNRGGELTGISTGYNQVDQLTGGLQPGELIILAARTSMGKTALALNIARNAAVYPQNKRVAVFSFEMTTRSLVLRLLCSEAEVDSGVFRSGHLSLRDHKLLSDAASKLSHAQIWIDDSSDLTVLEIKSKCRRLHADKGLDLVIVDYLQLAHADGKRRDRKDLEIAEISKGLKGLAKELDIPVIALSQLNRGPEQRDPDKRRPILGDLRESGAIEQDADLIAFIFRPYVYDKEADPALAELIIEKQRNGPIGTVKLEFKGRFARFEDWSGDGVQVPEGEGFVPPEGPGFAPAADPFDGEAPF